MTHPSKRLEFRHRGKRVPFQARRLLIAGFTGRDLDLVRQHVEELVREGVPRPPRVPDLYLASPAQLRWGGTVWTFGSATSGEVEYVLIVGDREVFVSIGSDHTDRDLERLSIEKSKQACAKVVSRQVWPLNELAARWDDLRLRSFVRDGDGWVPYQEGPLSMLIHPKELRKLLGREEEPGTMVFSGTLPVLDGKLRFASAFVGELATPEGEVLSRFSYNVRVLQPVSSM